MRLIGLAVMLAVSLGLAALTADAQQPRKIAKVGVLAIPLTDDPEFRVLWEAFAGGLRDYGWIENQNFVFERRTVAEGPERYSRPRSSE